MMDFFCFDVEVLKRSIFRKHDFFTCESSCPILPALSFLPINQTASQFFFSAMISNRQLLSKKAFQLSSFLPSISSSPSSFAILTPSSSSSSSLKAPFLYQSHHTVYTTKRRTFLMKRVKPLRPKLTSFKPATPDIPLDGLKNIEELVKKIDTTLTPEQQAYVDSLKKRMKGKNYEKNPSFFRDVPLPEELVGFNGFKPNVPENANQLIDWALAHIPVRGGPRRTKEKKRREKRLAIARSDAARRKAQTKAARAKDQVDYPIPPYLSTSDFLLLGKEGSEKGRNQSD